MRSFSKSLLFAGAIAGFLLCTGIAHAQMIEFGSGDRSGKAWGQGTVRANHIQVNSTASVPGFATQENVNAFAEADLSEPLQLRLTVLSNNTNPRVQILIKTPGHTAKYYADISEFMGTTTTVTVSTDEPLGNPDGSLGDLSAVQYIEVKGAWNSNTVRTNIRARELSATPAPVEVAAIEFGSGDRSGKAWGQGTVRANHIQVNSTASVPGFATQENVNVFAGADLSEPLQLRLTVLRNNTNPRVQILIKTPGNTAKYYADISEFIGTTSTVTVSADELLGNPDGSLGDLSAVEYIEVKGAWNSNTVRTNIRVRELSATMGSGGSTDDLSFPRNNSESLFTYAENVPFGAVSDTDGRRLELSNELLTENVWSDPSDEFYARPADENSAEEQPLGLGNFRVSCQWSHFNYDDPIAAPNTEHGAHLHMFFGNTRTDYSTIDGPRLTASGGGTCNGYALNRSAYWVPALMDGNDNTARVPESIIVYYKTRKVCNDIGGAPATNCQQTNSGTPANPAGINHSAYNVQEMPQGLELISGNNVGVNLNDLDESESSQHVFWSCGSSGVVLGDRRFNRIPSKQECLDLAEDEGVDESGVTINATVYFPQCWVGDANSNGSYDVNELTSNDPLNWTHVSQVTVDQKCPTEAPYRIPQLGFLLYWSLDDVSDTNSWYLSSDRDHNGNFIGQRGGTLHADWMAGWDENTMETWILNCLRYEKNCNFGQTGSDHKLRHEPQLYSGHPQAGMYGGQAQGSYLVSVPSKPNH